MTKPPDNNKHDKDPLKQITHTLERILFILLSLFAVATMAGAILIMLKMDTGSQSQGGRYYIAIAALVILGAIDTQFQKLLKRRIPFSLTTTPEERRYAAISLLLLFTSAVVLLGLAWLLP